ncbi:MAG: hybrid sensor histidine kinase/response regulator [Myxococcaceae bacterium]|nr:hybrid sensor histidine kinase/response regulator [Myxococcaceae bacterium]
MPPEGKAPKPLVIYVDDETANRVVFEAHFKKDFRIRVFASGHDALEAMTQETPAVVVSDQRMPNMSGTELLGKVRELYPDTVRVVLTAFSDPGAMLEAINKVQVSRYVVKPWEPKEMRAVIAGSIESYQLTTRVRALELQLIEATKMGMLGRLTSGLVHDMATPLSVIEADAERLASGKEVLELIQKLGNKNAHGFTPDHAEWAKDADDITGEIRQSVRHVSTLVAGVRETSRPVDMDTEADVASTVRFASRLVTTKVMAAGAELRLEVGDVPLVKVAPAELCQVVINVLVNAVQAVKNLPNRRAVNLVAVEKAGGVEVSVTDTGVGIPPALRERLGKQQITTKPIGEGTGLGVMICKSIVERAGGRWQIESQEGQGTKVTFWLPASSDMPIESS